MAYASVAEATDAGATGTPEQITAAIAAAQELVDLYTGDKFETTPDSGTTTVIGTYSNGQILLPYRVQSVSAIRFVGQDTDVDATAYRVRTSSVAGDIDSIEWVGRGSSSYGSPSRAVVTGVFGWTDTPAAVTRATALIAAYLTKNPTGSTEAGVRSLSVEGYSVSYGDNATSATTGVPEADMLLKPYRIPTIA